jgi:hypothetical protein
MTLGTRRSAGTRAILRELPEQPLGPLGLPHLKATAKIRAKVKARAARAAQVEEPKPSDNHGHLLQLPSTSSQLRLDDNETASGWAWKRRGRSNTASSALTTTSSSSSIIPVITLTESSDRHSPEPGQHHESQPVVLVEPETSLTEGQGTPAGLAAPAQAAEPETGSPGASFGPPSDAPLHASASSASLADDWHQHLTGPTPSSAAGVPTTAGRTPASAALAGDTQRDPRLITVSAVSHAPCD